MRIFLTTTFNIFSDHTIGEESVRAKKNATQIANLLIANNITCTSRIQDVRLVLMRYIDETINEYRVRPRDFKDMAEAVIESIIDGYEDILMPLIAEYYSLLP